MEPVTIALNTLQAEEKYFMGVLLPTVSSLRICLYDMKPMLKHAAPLATALIDGINKCFESYDIREDLIKASVVHPQFKTRWVKTEAARLQAKSLVLAAMTEAESSILTMLTTWLVAIE